LLWLNYYSFRASLSRRGPGRKRGVGSAGRIENHWEEFAGDDVRTEKRARVGRRPKNHPHVSNTFIGEEKKTVKRGGKKMGKGEVKRKKRTKHVVGRIRIREEKLMRPRL